MYQLVRKVLFWPTICSVAVTMDTPDTRSRILAEAIDAFGNRGYVAVSLDDLAEQLGVRKQTILYHFGSKAELFEATIDSAIGDLGETLIGAGTGRTGWLAVEAVVHAVFRIAVRQPDWAFYERSCAWVETGQHRPPLLWSRLLLVPGFS